MKKNIMSRWIAIIFIVFYSHFALSQPSTPSILGSWITYDLQHIPRSIVKFYPVGSNMVQARIIKILPAKGQKSTDLCIKCSGENFNKPKLGMVILWDLKKQGDKWEGNILDTDGGNIYSCKISVSADNQVLYLHAYKGIPLFGATVIWNRPQNKQ